MNILIVGGIARDHALYWKFLRSPKIDKVFVAPGNGGIDFSVDIAVDDYDKLIAFAKRNNVDIVYVSGDNELGDGLVDLCQEAGLKAFGPSRLAARIESSKAFAKDFMKECNIPTAKYEIFEDYDTARNYLSEQGVPIVIKASGLAAGKGAVVCQSMDEAQGALRDIMVDKTLGEAGGKVVIEEFLSGPEISIHAFSDGRNYVMFPPAQDHKAIYDGNKGPNTGGMGTLAPLPGVSSELMLDIEKRIVKPVIDGMRKAGTPFVGVLYPGVMLTKDGPKVLEYNARLGDPETQVYLRVLETDLLEVVEACIDGSLDSVNVEWSNKVAVNVVLASGGYPGSYEKGKEITGVDVAEEDGDVVVFHAGTKVRGGKLVTNGGRVLGVSALGDDLDDALRVAYSATEKIDFEGKIMRSDIGYAHDNSQLSNF